MKTTIGYYQDSFKKTLLLSAGYIVFALLFFFCQSAAFAQTATPYQWKRVVMGGGGFVTGIITCPTEKDLIYLRTDVGGSYRWNPVDSSWIPINDDLPLANWGLQGIESIAIDPSNPNYVYLAAGEYVQWSETAMLRSNNKGNSWWKNSAVIFKCGGNDYGRGVDERLAVDPNKGSTLLMGTRGYGLWKSTDSAATWKKITSFPVTTTSSGTGITFVKFIKESGTTGNETPLIFVGVARRGAANLYYSSDTGKTWQAAPGQYTGYMPIHAAIVADSLCYIAYSDTSGPYSASRGSLTKLNFKTWVFTDISPRKPSICAYSGISVYPDNPNIIYAGTLDLWPDEIYRSNDGGKTWKAILGGSNRHVNGYQYATVTYHWVADVEVDPYNPDHVFFVTGYGVWSTTNASNIDSSKKVDWYFTDKGLEETVVKEMISPTYGAPLLSAVGDYDGFRNDSLDQPSPYGNFKPSAGTNTGLAVAENLPAFMARVGSTGSYSLNGGKTWTSFKSAPSSGSNGEVAISADGSVIVWSPESAAAGYSLNKGKSWTSCDGLPANGLKIIADRVNPDKFYCYYKSGGEIDVSTDGGTFFSSEAIVPANGGILCTTPGKEGDLWLPTSSGLYHSVNSGTSFSKISSVESATAVGTGKALTGTSYPAIYLIGTVGGTEGIYCSSDTAKTWTRISDSKHNFGSIDLIIGDARVPGRVYVASDFNGIGVIYGMPLFDCNGDSTGTAIIDDCGVCSGGKTGVMACTKDCNGDVDGTAYVDACGKCVGGTTGKIDCTTGIDKKTINNLNVSPNPFNTTIQLKTASTAEYKIINFLGITEESGVCRNTCMIGKNLKTGIYLIEVRTKDETKIKRIIKQ